MIGPPHADIVAAIIALVDNRFDFVKILRINNDDRGFTQGASGRIKGAQVGIIAQIPNEGPGNACIGRTRIVGDECP
ncbi:MAG: hypothetical protein B5M51_04415 [Anaerolinea sp. 4484_236]|nr:MAG: hypothetical protein B5M51_04415 [Anaerolinea sp. 4484_236]